MTQGPPPPRADLAADPQHVLPMLDASPVAMMFSVGTAVRYANAASVQLLGYQAGEQATNLYVDVQQRDAIRAALARGEAVRGQEAQLRAKDGTVRTVLLTLMRWQMNGEDGVIGWSVDITERRQAEQQFRDFARASNDWFWETDAQHRFSAFYSGAEPFSEERINRLRGKTRWELPGPAQDALWAKHRAALDAREPFAGFEYQAIGIDGNPRWMRVAGVPMWSDDGQFLGYRGTASDITARKRTEVALQAALASARALNQRQKDLAELGADWFWETDANHRFVAMWGGRGSDQVAMRKHWIGREPWSRPVQTRPGDVEEWSAYRIAMEARLPFYNLEVSRIAPDGQPGWLSVSAKPRFDLDGTFLGYRGVSSRIDWRKKKEEELAEALQKAESAN